MHEMHPKLNSKESRIFLGNGKISDLAPLEKIKELFTATKTPKKYVVTLRPLKKRTNADGQPVIRKVLVNAEDVLKGRFMFDTKFTVRTPILDKIDESSENSTSSIELGKKDLKVAATYLRLSAGCGIDTTKKKGEEEDDDNITKGEKKDTKNETKDGVILTKDAQKKSGLSSSPNAVKEVKQKNDERKEEKKDAQKGTRSLPKAVEKTKHKTVEKKSNQKDSLMNNDSQKRIGNKEKDQKQEINKEIEKDNIREIYKANKGCTLPKIVEGEEKTEKNIDLSDEMRYGCLLAPENKRNFEVASVSENKIILKVKNSNTKDKEHAVTTFSNGPTSTKPNEVITTSFIEKLVAETQTVSCSATKVKDLFPPCKMRETPSAQHDQADLKTKSNRGLSNIYCPSPSDKEMCIRIQNLESQVIQISAEMKDLQKELLPSDDVAKLNLITRRFDEVNNLLLELKFNCMELKRCQRQMLERGHLTYGSEDSDWYSTTDSDSNEEFCSSNAHFETYNGNIHQGDDCYGRRRPIPVRLSNIFHRSPRPSPAQSNTNNLQPNRTYSNIRHNQYFTGRNPFEPSRQRTAESKYPAAAYRTSLHNFNTNLQSLNFTYNEPNYRKRRLTDTQKVVDSKCVATDSVIPVNASYQPTAERPYQHSFGIATHNFTASSSKKYATNDTTNNNKSPSKEYVITSRNAAGTDTLENRLTPIVNEIESDYYINDCPTEVVKSNTYDELPLVTHNLSKAIWNVIGNTSCDNIALTIFIERNNLYHINISVIQTGQCLGCVYTNEVAFEQAKKQNLFSAFFVFLVLNSDNSLEERSKVLGYSFDFVNINN